MELPYRDRADAGHRLGETLSSLQLPEPIVLALPRGGALVARPIADALGAPLDVWCVRKVGMPGHRELAIGAVASGDVDVLDQDLIKRAGIDDGTVDDLVSEARRQLTAQERALRGERAPLDVTGRVVIIVDDGLATGSTARATCQAVRAAGVRHVVLAVPVASPAGIEHVRDLADDIVCPATPPRFHAVGTWYEDFSEVSDQQVRDALSRQRGASTRRVGPKPR